MKKFSKLTAVLLSLVLCIGMIAPAFATDAYFYIKDGDKGWEFAGKGEVNNDVTFDENNQAVGAVNENGTLNTDVVTAPTGDAQGMQTTTGKGQVPKTIGSGTKEVDVQVKADTSKVNNLINQGDLTDGGTTYKYDTSNGTAEVLNDQYTYSVTWEVKQENGADAYVDEVTKTTTGGVFGIGGTTTYSGNSVPQTDSSKKIELASGEGDETNPIKNDIHVDAIVTKSQNTEVKVTIKNITSIGEDGTAVYGDGTTTGNKYIREDANTTEKDESGKTIVDRATDSLLASDFNKNYYNATTNGTEKTYTEKVVDVTYTVTDPDNQLPEAVKVQLQAVLEEKKSQTGATKTTDDVVLKAALDEIKTDDGTYSFGGWRINKNDDGSFSVTTSYTFEEAVRELPSEIVEQIFPDYYFNLDTIDDPAVPLASGPVTRAEFIDYLWRHEGEPASAGECTFTDVAEDHEYFAALCWADENGVAEAYFDAEGHEDGTFEPDELVTVAAVREFLDNFADVFGTNAVAAADLTTLTGEEDEAVLNCDEVLAEFFGEEYTPAEAEDDIAA